jgi:hypothetical protein
MPAVGAWLPAYRLRMQIATVISCSEGQRMARGRWPRRGGIMIVYGCAPERESAAKAPDASQRAYCRFSTSAGSNVFSSIKQFYLNPVRP